MTNVYRFVITGGQCAGKTEVLPFLKDKLTGLGYHVIVVPETASELTNMIGVTPDKLDIEGKTFYQTELVSLQMNKDSAVNEMIKHIMKTAIDKQIVVLYDRSILDGKAFCNKEEWENVMEISGFRELEKGIEFRKIGLTSNFGAVEVVYDEEMYMGGRNKEKPINKVIHLETAANLPTGYNMDNPARYGDKRFAMRQDELLEFIYKSYGYDGDHYVRIPAVESFELKKYAALKEILKSINYTSGNEIERKYEILVTPPDERSRGHAYIPLEDSLLFRWLHANADAIKKVEQVYIDLGNRNVETRVSRVTQVYDPIGMCPSTRTPRYYHTVKSRNIGLTRREIETELTETQYEEYVHVNGLSRVINKTRYVFEYQLQKFELDIIDVKTGRDREEIGSEEVDIVRKLVVLEKELLDEDEPTVFPPVFKGFHIKEVTDQELYRNANLSIDPTRISYL